MAKKKGKHESDKAQYAAYKAEGRHTDNKIAKLERTIKKQPNNEALKAVLAKWKKDGVPYRRNRRPVLAGAFKFRDPKIDFDLDKQKAYLKDKNPTKSPIWEALEDLYKSMKPKIRVKRRVKHKRLSTSS